MHFFKVIAAAATLLTTAQGARVRFFNTRSCSGAPSNDFQNVGCNTCIDPPGDWWAISVTDIGNQRWSIHNQDRCTPASQVGQAFDDGCGVAGNTALRSVWLSC